MGFDEGRLEFDHPNLVYYPGQVVKGKLVFDQSKVKSFRGIYMKMKGYCHVHWQTRHTRRVNDQNQTYYEDHDSHETYFEQKVYLMGSGSGEVRISPGHYEYPFQCMIPQDCPSSFEGSNGHIRYEVKVVVDRAFKFDQEKCLNITVINQRDLNTNPYCKKMMEFDFNESFCCWCMSSGTCEVSVRLPQSGYCPGQTIRADVSCANQSSVEIDAIKFEIIERRKFIATSNPDTRKEKNIIAKLKKGPIPGNTTRNWVVEIDIQQMDLYNIDACSYIDIDYEFEVTLSPSGCHSDSDQSHPLILGHIPLREFEDLPPEMGVETIWSDHVAAQPMAPSMTEYPGNQYGPNQTFPSGPSYPVTSQPYPGQNMPYPGVNTSPHPGGNMPAVSPYPGANPPYPGANPPYPTGNLPGVSPYPVGNEPYLPKPAEPGFTIPQPHAMPYPPNVMSSPYAKASAPEPGTPH